MPKNREERIAAAVRVLRAPRGTVAMKLSYLKDKGMTDDEITEAIANAAYGDAAAA